MTILAWILEVLEFIEFLALPANLIPLLWVLLSYGLTQGLHIDVLWAILLPAIPMMELYGWLSQSESDG